MRWWGHSPTRDLPVNKGKLIIRLFTPALSLPGEGEGTIRQREEEENEARFMGSYEL